MPIKFLVLWGGVGYTGELGGVWWACDTGAICQIGVSTWQRCIFWGPKELCWPTFEIYLMSSGSSVQMLHSYKIHLAHQNRTIAIASDFRVDGAKSPEIPQNEGVWGSEIAARNRKSLATFHRNLKSQCSIAFSCLGNRSDFWGPR